MNHTLGVSASLASAQGWPSTMPKVSGLKINYAIFCVMLHLLCFNVYLYYVLHNCDNHRQAQNQLHLHAYNIILFKNRE